MTMELILIALALFTLAALYTAFNLNRRLNARTVPSATSAGRCSATSTPRRKCGRGLRRPTDQSGPG